MSRGGALAVAVVAGALALAPAAQAHVEIRSTSPKAGSTVKRSLEVVRVTFTGPVRRGTLKVVGPGRRTVSRGSGGRDPRNVARVIVPLRSGLRAGRYRATVTWTAADGHRQTKSFSFRLR